ncbi:MAG TPA: hypothetical protein VE397_04710 [Stellaceae bacterium]|nr:hypothetical protein [Stellaceae bacterium]
MRALSAILKEIAGLFVDDGSLALAVLVWVALVALLARLAPAAGWEGAVLFLGLAALLAENTRRSARRR